MQLILQSHYTHQKPKDNWWDAIIRQNKMQPNMCKSNLPLLLPRILPPTQKNQQNNKYHYTYIQN